MSNRQSLRDNVLESAVPLIASAAAAFVTFWMAEAAKLDTAAQISVTVTSATVTAVLTAVALVKNHLATQQSLAEKGMLPLFKVKLTVGEAFDYIIKNADDCLLIFNTRFRQDAAHADASWKLQVAAQDAAIREATRNGTRYTVICDRLGLAEVPDDCSTVYQLTGDSDPLTQMVVLFRKDGRVDVLSGWGTRTQSLNDASVQLTSGESDAHVAALLDIFARYQAASQPVDMQARRAEPTATWPASYALT